jgi:chromosome segregation ATPase
MNQIKRVQVLLIGCIAIPAIGCSQAQLDPGVARSMVQLRRDLSNTKAQLGRTAETLRDIERNPRANTEAQVGFYKEEMDRLRKAIEDLRDVHMQMETKSEEYFKAWATEMAQLKDTQLVDAARQRKEASERAVVAVRAKLEELKTAGSPMMSALRDLERYLQSDRTADAAQAALPTIRKTLAMKEPVVAKFDVAIRQIDEVTRTVE